MSETPQDVAMLKQLLFDARAKVASQEAEIARLRSDLQAERDEIRPTAEELTHREAEQQLRSQVGELEAELSAVRQQLAEVTETTWYPCACGAEHDTPTCPFGAAPVAPEAPQRQDTNDEDLGSRLPRPATR